MANPTRAAAVNPEALPDNPFQAGIKDAFIGGVIALGLFVLLIGVIESLWSAYFSIDYKDVAAFSILAIVLVFLPSGLLGRPEGEKV